MCTAKNERYMCNVLVLSMYTNTVWRGFDRFGASPFNLILLCFCICISFMLPNNMLAYFSIPNATHAYPIMLQMSACIEQHGNTNNHNTKYGGGCQSSLLHAAYSALSCECIKETHATMQNPTGIFLFP